MDGPVFDAMLKTALEEALRQDAEEAPKPAKISRRHRKQMRQMLADPWGYARRVRPGRTRSRRSRMSRWLAAAVVAALLTGTAAGYALRGGETFRQMFENSPWAEEYGSAADTEQLLEMGGELDTLIVESNGLRFEMLDAVSDGQMAMVSVRLTVLEELDQLMTSDQSICFDEIKVVSEGGEKIHLFGLTVSPWTANMHHDLEPGQFSLIFTINDLALTEGGRYEIQLKDLMSTAAHALLRGEWTLGVTLRPAGVLELYPERVCKLNGADWTLEHLTASPLAMTMDFSYLSGEWNHEWDFLDDISINLRSGSVIGDSSIGAFGSDDHIGLTMEFHMPLDVSQIESVTICGEEIPLKK